MVAMSTDRPNEALRWLKERLATISDVNTARNALNWDRQTYMPYGGVPGRAEQVATLSRLVHEMLVSRETAELIAALEEPKPCSGVRPRRADRDGHRPPAGDGPLLTLPEEQVRRAVRAISVSCNLQQRLETGVGGLWLRRARVRAPSVTLQHSA